MNLSMYLGEVESQADSVEQFCQMTITGMEATIQAIDAFQLEPTLQGKTYASAKRYFMQTYRVIAQGMILLCQELQAQNQALPANFREEVAQTDVVEEELLNQIQEVERLQVGLAEMSEEMPLLKPMAYVYEACEQKLKEKLEALRLFHQTSGTYFDGVMAQAANVQRGLTAISQHAGFNSDTQTFHTMGMDLSWTTSIESAWQADQKRKQEAAEEALIHEYEENMPLPYIPKGNYAGFVVKDGKLDTEATLKSVDELVAANQEVRGQWVGILDFLTPIMDAVRLTFGVEPSTGKSIQASGRYTAAAFLLLPFVKVAKIEKFAKLARDHKAFKYTYEGYDDIYHLSKTEHVGKLRGEIYKLDGVMEKTIIYTKRSTKEAAVMRKSFNTTVRKSYLKNLVTEQSVIKELKEAGLKDTDITLMSLGKVPQGYSVHHKLPLDDSGTNDFANLILIKDEPYHKVITNAQTSFSKQLNPGESVKVKFPIPEGNIYPK